MRLRRYDPPSSPVYFSSKSIRPTDGIDSRVEVGGRYSLLYGGFLKSEVGNSVGVRDSEGSTSGSVVPRLYSVETIRNRLKTDSPIKI